MKPFVYIVILLMVVGLAAAADAPPSFNNHQFWGTVKWDKAAAIPEFVTVNVGAVSTVVAIKSSPCLDAVCTGTYGQNADNILRVTGEVGDTVEFFVNDKKVAAAAYKSGDATKLDLDATAAAVKPPASKDTGSSSSTKSSGTTSSGTTTTKTGTTDTGTKTGGTTTGTTVAPKTTVPPPVQKPVTTSPPVDDVSEEEDSGLIYIFIGAGVILVVGIVLLFLFIRNRNSLDPGVKAELKSTYEQGRARGMSDQQITQGLAQQGWDHETLSKFSK